MTRGRARVYDNLINGRLRHVWPVDAPARPADTCALMLNISNIDLDPDSSPHLQVQRLQGEKGSWSQHSSDMPGLGLSSTAVTHVNEFTI